MAPDPIDVDRLRRPAPVEAVLLDGFRVGEGPVRDPHRHGYHELILVRAGRGEQLVDGEPVPVRPGTVTVIGQGQVHQFLWAEQLVGGLVRFTDEALRGRAERVPPAWLLSGRGGRAIALPPGELDRADALVRLLAGEAARPPDPYAAGVLEHLLATLLLWLERWYDGSRAERRSAEDADVQLLRRFTERLEQDFRRHHDAAHYAGALALPGAALARALQRVTGRTTKELVLDRVMLEAARLLRFSDLTVGQVAHRAGFDDQPYFSRAFKRHWGESPQAYRDRTRGEVHRSAG
ncbi:MAG TPA: AraC family transcriptional regulator [Solirubrobacteraceae bacterium]|nr:AraC family transcriptional regulator [Solirubrobacteraceae bacterium]